MKINNKENGFSYIETIISLVIISIGMLGAISAMTWGIFYIQEAEKITRAKELANSTMESIFAVRDLTVSTSNSNSGSTLNSGWNSIMIKAGANTGIFLGDSYPVRESPGADGIYGTADDSCASGNSCNNNPEIKGYTRVINIADIVENNVVRKRRVDVTVSYFSGTIQRNQVLSTIISNLPSNN